MTGRRTSLRRLCAAGALLLAALPALAATPDFGGPWQIAAPGQPLVDESGRAPPLLPSARALQAKTRAASRASPDSDPARECLPAGVPRLLTQPFPFDIVEGRRTIGMLFEWNHLTRLIYMDRGHFDPIGPLYLGQSVGRWEGDTLVVDTNSYNDTTWLDDFALPHSDGMTTIERIRLVSGGTMLEDRITITDPARYARPWTARLLFARRPGIIKEDYCLGRMQAGRRAKSDRPAPKE